MPHIFGVRHLSPAAAWHLRQLLERVRPKLVLIEGSDDADELILEMLRQLMEPCEVQLEVLSAEALARFQPPEGIRP